MAKKWTNRNLPGALHFVTGNVHKRLPIFKVASNCIAFMEELHRLRAVKDFKTIAFVLMPDHFHLIVNPRDGDIQTLTGTLKSSSARRLLDIAPQNWFAKNETENRVWQESFKAIPLWSNWMIRQKVNYIHANPIRANLVRETKDYRWSSFHAFYLEQSDELLQIDRDWWWPDDVQKLERSMAEWDQEIEERRGS